MSLRARPPFDTPQAPPLGLKVPKAIAVYSVETGSEALLLIDLAAELREDKGRWMYPNFPGTVEALDEVADRLHDLYTRRVKPGRNERNEERAEKRDPGQQTHSRPKQKARRA